ncbi:MAG: AAA family ATPase [Spirulina sp. SIO3F2]|nr:AAA family ATPase [Spirulina sp. SIO3F2]
MLNLTNYQETELLYSGTRTLVYRATRLSDAQPVIIKVLRNPHPTFSELVQFRNQYVVTQNLDSPYIVKPLALERYNNGYALVMPDEGAVSLSSYWQDSEQALNELLTVAIQLAEALHILTGEQIIHKDIKPANILVHPETGQVQLIDFSIASLLPKEQRQLMNPKGLEGTLAYISPEQTGRMNRGIDYRSDFYSLGVTLYELLVGTVPFTADDPLDLINAHIAQAPMSPGGILNAQGQFHSQSLSGIIMRLMAKNAEERYQSALGLKHDLARCLQSLKRTGEIADFELGERDICDRFNIPEKLYGREAEVQTLLDAFERVTNGSSEMMLVAGFSGIGKTAVVNEVHKPIVRKKGYFIKGKFDQFNRNIPFSAFVQAFRNLMGQLLSESDEELANWTAQILKAVGENGQVLIDVIPELEQVIGVQVDAPALSGTAAQNRFNLLFQKFIAVFTTPEHPLVMFLDDLQWADSASLNLMKVLMGESERGYLLMLGAYRDNEVFPAHSLMLTLDELDKQKAAISTITLAPLPISNINQLIAETLSCSSEFAQPLTELTYRKTKGNPFFTTQFLKGLYEDNLIVFNRDMGCWECDLVQVKDAALTNDVVEFMASRLLKLPQATQDMLKLAACIGNHFDLETLAVVCDVLPEEVAVDLWQSLQEGLVIPESESYKFFQENAIQKITEFDHGEENFPNQYVGYRFLHDRVQQAAYLLIEAAQKQSVHLTIGKLLLSHQEVTGLDNNIFDILNHLMIGISADPLAISSEKLSRLALSAGMKAKLSVAYEAAISYFDFGLSQLPFNSWQNCYQIKLDISREKAECHYFLGHFEESERILNDILLEVKSPLDEARIHGILMTQRTTQGTNILLSVEAGIKGLAVLGMEIPTNPEELRSLVEQEHQQVRHFFTTSSPTILLELAEMSDPVQQSCMKLLSILWSAAYVAGDPNLNWFTTLRMMNLSLKYGHAESSGFAYCSYGMTLAYQGEYREAYAFGRVALDADRKFNNTQFIAKNNNHFGHAINPYTRPLKENLSLYEQSFTICTELGDLIFGVWAADFIVWTHIIKGSSLDFVHAEIQKYMSYVRDVNDLNMLSSFELKQQFVQALIKKSASDDILTYDAFLEHPLVSNWRQKKYDHGINWYGFLVLQWLYLQGQYTEAIQIARALKPTLPANFGFSPIIIYHTYYPLSLTALYFQSDSQQQAIDWQELDALQKVLHTWSQNCPYNFLHKYQLVSAEISRVHGDRLKAMELYNQAIVGAKENEYIQDEALANELAAKFYLDWHKAKYAALHMQEAYYCYARWGAKAKTDHLETNYPKLLTPILQKQRVEFNVIDSLTSLTQTLTATLQSQTQSSVNISEAFDFAAILQAAQKLSSTIELDELLGEIAEIILTNAGAQKMALLMPDGEQWQLQTTAGQIGNSKIVTQTTAQPLTAESPVPIRLIQYVKNTQEPVLISEAKTGISGILEGYLLKHQPQSVLCVPLLNQGNLVAIAYLEHLTTKGIFTPNRQTIIEFLCAQAAVALQNAQLYSQAQQAQARAEQSQNKAEQALVRLQQAQIQLVQSEKMSALGNLVAGVAHEINNPVGFIGGNVSAAQEHLQDLLEILSLYQEHTSPPEEIAEAIADLDPEFIAEDFPKLIASMESGCDRIRNISTSLRTFSRTDTDKKMEFNVHDGINSTLLILKYRLKANEQRPAIEVVKKYDDIPAIYCYAGQLSQVLMNLFANAIDALDESNNGKTFEDIAKEPNCITVETEFNEAKESILVKVSDNGMGMPETVKARIFEQGFTTKGVGKGTGLGMAIAYQIITEKHGGAITCASELGQGTTFTIQLPLLSSYPE